ncbi:unnamed protein product [Trichogramma brassicae]|uniref:CRAL-TRIO domain-containing protein n=1 Tax=Trichogramma brassicae TaxID=86971 RepID=A0A6H5IXE8_9HYME|nr:unnamed protein product [Trichogramma brassicae]
MVLREKLNSVSQPMIGSLPFSLDFNELSDQWKAYAAEELRETPENVEEGLKILREKLAGEPDLVVPTSQEHLEKFLRPCKWYPDSAFELMKRFYKYRASHPKYCQDLTPTNERTVILSGTLSPLPRINDDGVRVFLIEAGKKWKPKEVTLDQIFRGVIFYLEAAISEPRAQVCGVRVIVDMDGLSLSQVTHFTPSFAGAVAEFVQRCLPCRLKGIHIVNQPIIFNMVFAFFKPFLHEKMRKRIVFHGTNWGSLRPFFDAATLPKKYGGDLDFPEDSFLGEKFFSYVMNFEDEFLGRYKSLCCRLINLCDISNNFIPLFFDCSVE